MLAGSLRINLNGCPNACAQYQVADIGLQGGIARLPDGSRVQGFIVHIGGRLGEDAGFGRRVSSKPIPADDAKLRGRAARAGLRGRAARGRHVRRLGRRAVRRRLAALAGVAVAREPAEAAA